MSPDHLLCLQHLQNERIFDKQTLLEVALENEEEDIHHIHHRDRNSRGQNNLEGEANLEGMDIHEGRMRLDKVRLGPEVLALHLGNSPEEVDGRKHVQDSHILVLLPMILSQIRT